MKISKVVYLGRHRNQFSSSISYRHVLIVTDEIGYVVNLESDARGERLCFDNAFQFSFGRNMMWETIEANRQSLRQVIICEPFREINGLDGISIDDCFDNMDVNKIQKIKDFLSEQYQTIISELQKIMYRQNRSDEAKKLLQEFRYQDARAHCHAFELDYDALILAFIKSHR